MILDRSTRDDRVDHWEDESVSDIEPKESSKVTRQERADRYGQQPATILLTGLDRFRQDDDRLCPGTAPV